MNVIEVENAGKVFRRHTESKLLRQQLSTFFRPRSSEHLLHALRNVSFRVGEGESLAVLGANGAGKYTLLNLIAGLTQPDSGKVRVTGRVAALLELGAGFHHDLTGYENLFLNAALLGFNKKQILERKDAIIGFSELDDFIFEPIRTYSQGMILRLAFSIAVHVNPKILIVDEVLGVGDAHFQKKCAARIAELRQEGRTLICVSHSPQLVSEVLRPCYLAGSRPVVDGRSCPRCHGCIHGLHGLRRAARTRS